MKIPNLKTKQGKHTLAVYGAIISIIFSRFFPESINTVDDVVRYWEESQMKISDIMEGGGVMVLIGYIVDYLRDKKNLVDE